jgi:hypothetical protein
VRQPLEGRIESPELGFEQGLAVDVERRPHLGGELGDCHIFTTEFPFPVSEWIHSFLHLGARGKG